MFGALGGLGDLGNLMKMAKDLQGNMKNVRQELESSQFTGKSRHSEVQITLSGTLEVKNVSISPAAISPANPSALEAMVKDACTDALNNCKANLQAKLKSMTGGMIDMPDLF